MHIGYVNDSKEVRYASNRKGGWEYRTIHYRSSDRVGIGFSLAVDNRNQPHMMYIIRPNAVGNTGYIHYATLVDDELTDITVALEQNPLTLSNLALDSEGHAYVCMLTGGGSATSIQEVYVLTNATGAWEATYLGDHKGAWSASTAVDTMGIAHIAYTRREVLGDPVSYLAYATNATGTWESEPIFWPQQIGMHDAVSIAVSADGIPEVVFVTNCDNTRDGGVKYSNLRFSEKRGQTWDQHSMFTGEYGEIGYTAISVSPDGYPVFAYIDWSDGINLMFRSDTSSSVLSELVQAGILKRRISLAVTGAGVPYIAYSAPGDDGCNCLYYSWKEQFPLAMTSGQ